jgi:hypothetical protein
LVAVEGCCEASVYAQVFADAFDGTSAGDAEVVSRRLDEWNMPEAAAVFRAKAKMLRNLLQKESLPESRQDPQPDKWCRYCDRPIQDGAQGTLGDACSSCYDKILNGATEADLTEPDRSADWSGDHDEAAAV